MEFIDFFLESGSDFCIAKQRKRIQLYDFEKLGTARKPYRALHWWSMGWAFIKVTRRKTVAWTGTI